MNRRGFLKTVAIGAPVMGLSPAQGLAALDVIPIKSNYVVSDYNPTTKVATISQDWATTPDETSVFVILPNGSLVVG